MKSLALSYRLRERWYGPLLLTLALLVALGGLLYLLEQQQTQTQQERLVTRSSLALQGMEVNLRADREVLELLAQGMARGMIDIPRFQQRVVDYVASHQDLQAIAWRDKDLMLRWVGHPADDEEGIRWLGELPEPQRVANQARHQLSPLYSDPFLTLDQTPALLLVVPIVDHGRFLGVLEGLYRLEGLLTHNLPRDLLQSYRICLEDPSGRVASVCTTTNPGRGALARVFPLPFLGENYQLRVSPFEENARGGYRFLVLGAIALSLGLGWGMWMLQRDMKLRRRVEADLQYHLNLLQTILASTPDSVAVKDLQGQYRLINRAGAGRMGLPIRQVIGRTDADLFGAKVARPYRAEDEAVLEQGHPRTCEETRSVDGRERHMLTTRTAYRDQQGVTAGLVEVCRDITALKRSEIELRRSEQRFRSVFESAGVGIALLNEEGLILQVNDRFAQFLGYLSGELVGRSFLDVTHPEGENRSKEAVPEHRDGADLLQIEKPYLRKDGTSVWGHESVSTITDESGKPVIRVAMVQDIDDRRRAETALRQSEERYRMLFSAGSDPILAFDARTGELVDANPAAEELSGYPLKALRTMHVGQLFAESPAGRSEPLDLLSAELRRIPVAQLLRADERTVPVELTAGRYVWQERPMMVAMVRDITERQALERMKDEMLSSVSHEMRTPLTAMLGFVEFLLDNEVDPEQQREFLGLVVKETHRLKELIDNLLNLQRLRAGVTELRQDQVSVEALLHDVVALFSPKTEKHRFRIDCPGDLPPLLADERQLFQALRNLVSNAVKYSPDGGEVVLGANKSQDRLHVWVRDEGLGVPAMALEQIFERFYRLGGNGHQKIGGTGLGLPLVKEIVEGHGGKVWAESDGVRGSTFHMSLPLPAFAAVRQPEVVSGASRGR